MKREKKEREKKREREERNNNFSRKSRPHLSTVLYPL